MGQTEKCEDLKVFIRFLPSKHICREIKFDLKSNTIYVRCRDATSQRVGQRPKPPQYWSFHPNKVLFNSTQEHTYDEVITGILENSMNKGNDAVIMAYGQVGSGKTFTMTGLQNKFYQLGLIPRFISHVVQLRWRSDITVSCDVSYIEIIGQRVTDLFTGKQLKVEDIVKRVPKMSLTSERGSLERLFQAESRRKVADSVRSGNRGHGIITFYLETLDLLDTTAKQQMFKVHFVDLAGVESFGQTQDAGKKAFDIGNSNFTKYFLDQCVRHLGKPPKQFASDLAVRFLGDSLTNDSTLRFIGHVKVSEHDLPVSLSLLRFSSQIAGMKFDQITPGPSLPHCNQQMKFSADSSELSETILAVKAQIEAENLLRNYPDYQVSEKHVCNERIAKEWRSKAYEYLDRASEDVSDKKTEKTLAQDDVPKLPAESLGVYDPPIPTNFDFENDPMFNNPSFTQDKLTLTLLNGKRSKLKSQNGMQPAQSESRKRVVARSVAGSRTSAASRSRIETQQRADAQPPAPDYPSKTNSPLQNLMSLKIAKEIVSELESNSKMLKAEMFNLFKNKLDRKKNISNLDINPSFASQISILRTKKTTPKDPASQNGIRQTISKRNTRSALSANSVTSRSRSDNRVAPVACSHEMVGPPPPREIDEKGVTIGPAALYPCQGPIVEHTKRARAAGLKRHEVQVVTRVTVKSKAKPTDAKNLEEVIKRVMEKQMFPPGSVRTPEAARREKEAAVTSRLRERLRREVDVAKQVAARKRADLFETMRRLEWCRYQWVQANDDLLKERGRSGEHKGKEKHMTTTSRENQLSEFVRCKMQEFHDVQQELLVRRDLLNNALVLVDQARKNMDKITYKIYPQLSAMTELDDEKRASDSEVSDRIVDPYDNDSGSSLIRIFERTPDTKEIDEIKDPGDDPAKPASDSKASDGIKDPNDYGPARPTSDLKASDGIKDPNDDGPAKPISDSKARETSDSKGSEEFENLNYLDSDELFLLKYLEENDYRLSIE